MKIGVIGSGIVGQTLAKGFKSEGHEVILGTRDTSKEEVRKFHEETSIKIGTFEDVAGFGEVIVLATKGSAAEDAIQLAGKYNFEGKIVIDTTNPIEDEPPTNGVLHFTTSLEKSLMEQLQELLPDAKFVKAFSSTGNALFYKPQLKDGPPTMFICGNDDEAKKAVTGILTSFGWETEDCGKVEAARAIEPLCMLWCIAGFLKNDWVHAYKLLKA